MDGKSTVHFESTIQTSKMKSFVALLFFAGAIAIIQAQPLSTRGLTEDLQDFLDLLPVDDILKVLFDYYENDKETQDALKYLQSKDFAAIWDQVLGNKEFQDFVKYLQDAGLDVIGLLNTVADFLELPHFPGTFSGVSSLLRKEGLSGLLDEVLALLPLEELEALFEKKLETSPEFKALYDKIASADFQKLVDFVKNSKELTELFQKLRDHGIDVDKFVEVIAKVFGWK